MAVQGSASTAASRLRSRDAGRLRRYRQYQDFYEGRHFERPRNGRSNLVLNYARAVVDKGIAYLLGRGVTWSVLAASEENQRQRRRAERIEQLLYDVGFENDVEAVDLQVAQNAAVMGDGVYKVFWDPSLRSGQAPAGQVRILSIDPRTFFPTWAGDDASAMRRVDVVYSLGADDLALGRYGLSDQQAAALAGNGLVDVVESWTAAQLQIVAKDQVIKRAPNPYGAIPFVHVPNLPLANDPWGQSDLVDVLPINREIDERVSDQADIIRFHADPPVIFKGVSDHGDLAVGPGTVWDIPADADVSLLEWRGQPVAVQEHIDRLYRSLYEVAETPRSSFGDSGRMLSGVALEVELRPIVQRTQRRRVWWTRALVQRSRLVLSILQAMADRQLPGDPRNVRIRVVWPPMLPRDDVTEVQNQVALVGAGLRSHRTAMDSLGEESPEEELERVVADRTVLTEAPSPNPSPASGRGE